MNNLIRHFNFIFIVFFILLFSSSLAQTSKHKETKEDNYISQKNFSGQTSSPFFYYDEKIYIAQVNVNSNGNNILGDAANEPSIAIDLNNPSRIAIGWRQFDNVSSNFRQAGYSYTSDGGVTWNFPGVIEPGIFRSDPVLNFDAEGNFYYNSLTSQNGNYWCTVFKSVDGGATWNSGTYAQGGDKQWMEIDKTSGPGKGHIYAAWNGAYSSCGYKSFTRSTDGGETFEECVSLLGRPYWGTLAVAKNGDLFVTGYDGIYFTVLKSTNAKFADSTVTFGAPIAVDMNGALPGYGGPNPGGITGQISVDVDTSNGLHSGNVYLLATVANKSNGDPADIFIARSRDGGDNWDNPVKINDDNSDDNWQWFGTLSVAPNGRIDAVWLDTRNSSSNSFISELYYSFSYDGGETWYQNVSLLPEGFDPHVGWPNQNKIGDYYDMVSDNEGVHLAMSATFNGEQDVYYARIFTNVINSVEEDEKLTTDFTLEQNYPNPFNPTTTITFSIFNSHQNGEAQFASLKIYDSIGRKVQTLLNKDLQPGKYRVDFNADHLSSGVYFYTLTAGKNSATKKMLLVK